MDAVRIIKLCFILCHFVYVRYSYWLSLGSEFGNLFHMNLLASILFTQGNEKIHSITIDAFLFDFGYAHPNALSV